MQKKTQLIISYVLPLGGEHKHTSLLSITNSLTQRKNMFSPWLSFSFLQKKREEEGSVYKDFPGQQQCSKTFRETHGLLPEKVEVLQSLSWIRGLEFTGVEHQKPHEVQTPHARGVTNLMAYCNVRSNATGVTNARRCHAPSQTEEEFELLLKLVRITVQSSGEYRVCRTLCC